ncbi:MAG: flagellar hook-associated protein FlgK [Thermodesulfobacteriota bacterium]
MSGILGLMDIARRTLAASQVGVEVTSNNISNADTAGYSRQIVILENGLALDTAYGQLGTGVKVTGVERAFDSFVTANLDKNTSSLSEYKSKADYLEQVASLFNETTDDGLSELFANFWNAWSDLADNPSGAGERQSLLTQAENLADALGYRSNQLVQIRTAITQEINATVSEINNYTAQIAELNKQIVAAEADGSMANDLRDQRNMALNSLSGLIGISYYTSGDSTINVSLTNGTSLVEGVNARSLRSEITSSDTVSIIWEGPGGTEMDITSGLSGGELSAQIEIRDTKIPEYQSDFDDIAKTLIVAVNGLHSQGVGLEMLTTATSPYYIVTGDLASPLVNNPSLAFGDSITAGQFTVHVEDGSGASAASTITITGATTLADLAAQLNAVSGISATIVTSGTENRLEITADAGYSFGFSEDSSQALMALGINSFFTGDSASNIGVNEALVDNVNLIAAGQIDPTTGDHPVGDNNNALLLAELSDQAVGPGGLTFDAAYQQLVMNMGLDAEQAGNNQDFYQGLVDQCTELRNSISGVNLDEELTNLLKFQRIYQAAAQIITAADEMLQTLLEIK